MKIALYVCAVVIFFNGGAWASDNCVEARCAEARFKKITKVARGLNPKVLQLALNAFFLSQRHEVIKKPIITIIDYTLASDAERLWVIDLAKGKLLHRSMVAHGVNSGVKYSTTFSNRVGSLQTSLGTFVTEDTYFGRDGYSLRMRGLERGFNDNAKKRYIVLHGAPYVSKSFLLAAGRIGRSWGCPAVEHHLAKPIIDTIKHGSLIFAYYPDRLWLGTSKFVAVSKG